MAIEDLKKFIEGKDLPRAGNVIIPEPTMMENLEGFAATLDQGVFLGLGDELEASVKKALGDDRPYEEIRNEVRRKIQAFERNHPGIAITTEMLGAIAPTVLMMLNPTGSTQPMAMANTTRLMSKVPKFFEGMGRKGLVSSAEGGVYAYGKGEKGIKEDLSLVPGGMAWSVGGTIALDTLFKAGTGAFNIVVNRVREKMGDKPSRVVEKELKRLQEETGLNIAEIVAGVQNGQLMVENQTLITALQGLFKETPQGKQVFKDLANIREESTRKMLEKNMIDQLTPGGKKGHLVEYFNKSSSEIKKEAKDDYDAIFKNDNFEAPDDLKEDVVKVLQARPDIAKELNSLYVGDIVPPYKIAENGAIELIRYPTIRDAEIIRRRLDEIIDKLWKEGDGTFAEKLKPFENNLRNKVDEYAPRIKTARQKWSNLISVNDAYKDGLNALGKKTEILQQKMRELKNAPPTIENQNILNAYRNGVMITLKDNLSSPGYAGQIIDPNHKTHTKIRAIFDEDRVEDVIEQARITNESIAIRNSVTGKGGAGANSQTQEKLKEDIQRSATEPVNAMTNAVLRPILNKFIPNIDEKGVRDVLSVLYETNPEKVRKILTGRTDMGELQELINMNMNAITRVLSPSIAVPTSDTGMGQLTQDQLNLLPVQ